MINQDTVEFLDQIACDWKVKYNGRIYFFEGWTKDNKSELHVYTWEESDISGKVNREFVYEAKTMDECKRDFLKSPIFENWTFWQVQEFLEIIDE